MELTRAATSVPATCAALDDAGEPSRLSFTHQREYVEGRGGQASETRAASRRSSALAERSRSPRARRRSRRSARQRARRRCVRAARRLLRARGARRHPRARDGGRGDPPSRRGASPRRPISSSRRPTSGCRSRCTAARRRLRTRSTLAVHAAEVGADAVVVIGPPYFKLDEQAQYGHFLAAATACAPLPFYVYEFAATTGYAVAPAVLERLRDDAPNVVGLKVSDTPFDASRSTCCRASTSSSAPRRSSRRGWPAVRAVPFRRSRRRCPREVAAVVRDPRPEGAARLGELRAFVERFPRQAALKRLLALQGVPVSEDVRAPLRVAHGRGARRARRAGTSRCRRVEAPATRALSTTIGSGTTPQMASTVTSSWIAPPREARRASAVAAHVDTCSRGRGAWDGASSFSALRQAPARTCRSCRTGAADWQLTRARSTARSDLFADLRRVIALLRTFVLETACRSLRGSDAVARDELRDRCDARSSSATSRARHARPSRGRYGEPCDACDSSLVGEKEQQLRRRLAGFYVDRTPRRRPDSSPTRSCAQPIASGRSSPNASTPKRSVASFQIQRARRLELGQRVAELVERRLRLGDVPDQEANDHATSGRRRTSSRARARSPRQRARARARAACRADR